MLELVKGDVLSKHLFFKVNLILLLILLSSCTSNNETLNLNSNDTWIGAGIAYGPFRDGQEPGGNFPTINQLSEDLHIISKRWKWIRLYGSRGFTSDILDIIKKDKLDIKVMLGAWIAKEENSAEAKANNKQEIDEAIKLANDFPNIINSINIGNETMVFWSDHKVDINQMKEYIKYTADRVNVPVTTSDDFNFWNKEESMEIAEVCDFIVVHIHPLWAGLQIDSSVDWVQNIYQQIKDFHPEKTIVIGETGWATNKHNQGLQHELIKGIPNEENQMIFYNEFRSWAIGNKIPHHFFVVFDENWKGGNNKNEVEKHWGLYYSNRKPKLIFQNEISR
tara:strand:+ start:13625 stop:14632 length:1008 start_codon:yes stop_codon:yes gene_type:complete